mgnify:CR=1 FL=1
MRRPRHPRTPKALDQLAEINLNEYLRNHSGQNDSATIEAFVNRLPKRQRQATKKRITAHFNTRPSQQDSS